MDYGINVACDGEFNRSFERVCKIVASDIRTVLTLPEAGITDG